MISYWRMDVSAETLYTALAHPTRLRCLLLLRETRELCVCELTRALGASQPHVSRHLAHLREIGLVSDRREGLWIHYRLHPDLPAWVKDVLRATAKGVGHAGPYASDAAALEPSPGRVKAARCF